MKLFEYISSKIQDAVAKVARDVVVNFAESIVNEVKETIDLQKLDWIPLSTKYLRYKERHNLDTRILIATSFYRDNITWYVKGGTVYFGVKDIVHEPSGMPLPILARIHEFGTSTVPARPLWHPVLNKHFLNLKTDKFKLVEELTKEYDKDNLIRRIKPRSKKARVHF